MSMNPLEVFLKSTQGFMRCVQTQFFQFVGAHSDSETEKQKQRSLFSVVAKPSLPPHDSSVNEPTSLHPISSSSKAKPLTKEELGRATWTLLHTLAAQVMYLPFQGYLVSMLILYCFFLVCLFSIVIVFYLQYPDNPTRQQKLDVKELMAILSRLYPCKDCADHFGEILKSNPVQAGSHAEFSQWLCYVHNVVNRSLGKVNFPCQRVDARWGKLECKDRACDLEGEQSKF